MLSRRPYLHVCTLLIIYDKTKCHHAMLQYYVNMRVYGWQIWKKTIIVIDSGFTSYGALGHVSPGFQQFHFSSFWSKSDSQLSKYCVVYEISWCRCQQLTALLISTALVTKLLFIKPLLHPALKSAVSAPWHNLLCPSSQQILATPLITDCNHTSFFSEFRSYEPAVLCTLLLPLCKQF